MRDEKGRFTEGNNGKPKGAISEKTKIWNEIGEWFAGEGLAKYQSNLMAMMDSSFSNVSAEGMKRYETLLEYFKPKLSRAEIKAEVETKGEIDLSKLPKEVLDKLLDESNENTTTS